MNWIDIVDIAAGLMIHIVLLEMVNLALEPKRNHIWIIATGFYYMIITFVFRQIVLPMYLSAPLQIVGMFAPLFLLYPSERFFRKIYCAGSMIAGEIVAVPMSMLLISMITGVVEVDLGYAHTPMQLMRDGFEVAILLPVVYCLLLPMKHHHSAQINWAGYALFISSQALIMMVSLLLLSGNPQMMRSQFYALIFCVALCVAADIALYRTIQGNLRAVHSEAENERLREMQQLQLRHSRELHDQLNETAILRHDIHNHLRAMDILFAQDAEKGRAYLSHLIEALPDKSYVVFCPNPVLNATLYAKALRAAECGVTLAVQARLPAELPIDDVDLVSVFGNLLDNAIQASSLVDEAVGRQVHLEASVHAGHLHIRCGNTCAGVRLERGIPARREGEGLGTGIRAIRAAAQKYGGQATFSQKDGQFAAEVTLALIST